MILGIGPYMSTHNSNPLITPVMKRKKFGRYLKLEAEGEKEKVGFGKSIALAVSRALVALGRSEEVKAENEIVLSGDKGTLLAESQELVEGAVVFMKTDDGRSVAADGTYEIKDGPQAGQVVEVKDGAVLSLKAKEVTPDAKSSSTKDVDHPEGADPNVVMAAVKSILELSSENSDLKAEKLIEQVKVEMSKVPVVKPLAGGSVKSSVEKTELSTVKLAAMSVPERAQAMAINLIAEYGDPNANKRTDLASGEPNITTTYAGEFALPYISPAVLSGDTLSKRLITVKENVGPKGVVVKPLALTNIIQAASCDFTHQGGVALTERKLVTTDLKVNLELCKKPFLEDWEAMQMGAGRMNKSLPPNFESHMLTEVAAIVAGNMETRIWRDTESTGAGHFDGLDVILNADKVDGSAGAITSANVVTKIREAISEIPAELRFHPDMVIYVPGNIVQLYVQKLGDQGFMDQYQTGSKPLNIDGYPMVYVPGKTAGTITIAKADNLWFGTDLVSDHAEAKLIDMEPTTGSDNVRVIMKFTAGVQYGKRPEIVQWVNPA